MSRSRVAVLIPARDAAETIADTVAAAARLPGSTIVVVCDDASRDDTADRAAAAGAIIVTHRRGRGRAATLESSVNALGVLEQRDRRPECGTLVLVDAELGAAVAGLAPVVEAVRDDKADLAIARPAGLEPDGLLATSAARGIAELTGWTAHAPLSTCRALTRRAFELASPLATGFGADAGMTVDAIRAELRVVEIDVDVPPPPAASDLLEQLERARAAADLTRAFAARGLVQKGVDEVKGIGGLRGLIDRIRP